MLCHFMKVKVYDVPPNIVDFYMSGAQLGNFHCYDILGHLYRITGKKRESRRCFIDYYNHTGDNNNIENYCLSLYEPSDSDEDNYPEQGTYPEKEFIYGLMDTIRELQTQVKQLYEALDELKKHMPIK